MHSGCPAVAPPFCLFTQRALEQCMYVYRGNFTVRYISWLLVLNNHEKAQAQPTNTRKPPNIELGNNNRSVTLRDFCGPGSPLDKREGDQWDGNPHLSACSWLFSCVHTPLGDLAVYCTVQSETVGHNEFTL